MSGQLQGIDLFLNFVEHSDGSFLGDMLFNAGIFNSSTAKRILMLFKSLLSAMEAEPDVETMAQIDLTAVASSHVVARRAKVVVHANKFVSPF